MNANAVSELKRLRLAAGLGFNDAWRSLGTGSAHLARWERGETEPSARYIRPLAQLYGVTADTILDALERQRVGVGDDAG